MLRKYQCEVCNTIYPAINDVWRCEGKHRVERINRLREAAIMRLRAKLEAGTINYPTALSELENMGIA